jgi:hypothetical protein
VAAYLQVTLNRIADPTVPDGCLLTVSATQFPALDAEGQAMFRAMIDGLRAMLLGERPCRRASVRDQNIVLSLAEVAGTSWTTSQCSQIFPSWQTRKMSTTDWPRSSGLVR